MKKLLWLSLVILTITNVATAQADDDIPAYGLLSDYGQNRSIGVSIFGNGFVGVPLRFVRENRDQIEIVPSLSGLGFLDGDGVEVLGPGIMGGYNILVAENFNHLRSKIVRNYVSPKIGAIVARAVLLSVGVTWRREVFNPKIYHKSLSFDLGLRVNRATGDVNFFGNADVNFRLIGGFIRLDLNWFRPK